MSLRLKSLVSIASCPLLVSIAACGGTAAPAPGDTADSGTSAPDSFVPSFTKSVDYPSVTVAPGGEDTQCVVLDVGNDSAMHVGRIHNSLSPGSHHLIVYRTVDTVEQKTPFACKPFSDLLKTDRGTPLMISQKHDDSLELPTGVGIGFTAHQFLRLEMHWINATKAPIEVKAHVELQSLSDADYKDELGFLFMGDPDINVPAHGKASVGPVFGPIPDDIAGVNFFAITGHEHRYGKGVKISTSTAKTGGTDASVYDLGADFQWSEPTTVFTPAPFTIPKGGGFKFQCDWENTGDTAVKFGESATNEMCFFWAYYYPAKTARVCLHTEALATASPTSPIDICCPDDTNPICGYVQSHL